MSTKSVQMMIDPRMTYLWHGQICVFIHIFENHFFFFQNVFKVNG